MPRLGLLAVGVTGGVTGVLGALPFCVLVDEPLLLPPELLLVPELELPLELPEPVVLPVLAEPEVAEVEVVDPEPAAAGVPDELAPDPPQALNNNVKPTAAATPRT
jgi:hypothetical protein